MKKSKGGGEAKLPHRSPGGVCFASDGLENDAGFGEPGLNLYRTDVPNEVGTGNLPLRPQIGSDSKGGVLSKFLKGSNEK